MVQEQNKPIRVLIVDDHAAMRAGLRSMLDTETNICVVGAAAGGREAIDMIVHHGPDVLLLDLRMREMDGIAVMLEMRKRRLPSRVIVLTSYETDEDVYRAVNAGARGYILKDGTEDELIEAITSVHAGKSYFPKHVAERLADRMHRISLSIREIEVLEVMACGLTNKEIGQALQISSHTVRCHVAKITSKLEVSDRTEAVTAAIRFGIIQVV